MNTSSGRKQAAKIKFFALYMLSIILIVVMLSSFFQPLPTQKAEPEQAVRENSVMTIDALLHAKSEKYQALLLAAEGGKAGSDDTALIGREKLSQSIMVDSIRHAVADWEDDKAKEDADRLLEIFVRNQQWQTKMAARTTMPSTTSARADEGSSLNEITRLKNLLQQKESEMAAMGQTNKAALEERDKMITALKNRPVPQPTTVVQKTDAGAVSEWIVKYNKLKSSSERNNTQFNNLQASYREVVADNRRLLTQLQMLKAGKNNR